MSDTHVVWHKCYLPLAKITVSTGTYSTSQTSSNDSPHNKRKGNYYQSPNATNYRTETDDRSPVLRIKDVYPRSDFSHTGSEFFHPGSRIRIKEFKYFNHKWFLSSRKYVRVVYPGSGSWIGILTFYPSRIQGQKSTGSLIHPQHCRSQYTKWQSKTVIRKRVVSYLQLQNVKRKESSAYLHHGGLGEGPVRILDNPDGAQVVEHPTLTLEEGRLLLHQLYLQVLLVTVLLQINKKMHIYCRFTNIQNFKETCTYKDYADCLMVHFSVISCWYTLAGLLLSIFPIWAL
jgi:hypothetical protein